MVRPWSWCLAAVAACGGAPAPAEEPKPAPVARSEDSVVVAPPEEAAGDVAPIPIGLLLRDAQQVTVVEVEPLRAIGIGKLVEAYALNVKGIALAKARDECGFEVLASLRRAYVSTTVRGSVMALEPSVPIEQLLDCFARIMPNAKPAQLDDRRAIDLGDNAWATSHEGALIVGDETSVRELLGLPIDPAPEAIPGLAAGDVSKVLGMLPRGRDLLVASATSMGLAPLSFELVVALRGSRESMLLHVELDSGGGAAAGILGTDFAAQIPQWRPMVIEQLDALYGGAPGAEVLMRLFDTAQIDERSGRIVAQTQTDDVPALLRALETLAER